MTRMPVITNNFDFAGGIQADRLGRRDGLEIKRQNDTQTLGQHLASGNTGQAAKFALNNGMVNEGMKLQGMERERAAEAAKKKADRLASLVYAADTPDKWGQMIGRLKQTGVNLPDQYNDFGSRDMVLAEYAGLTGVKAAREDARADAALRLKQSGGAFDPLTRLKIEKLRRELNGEGQPQFKVPSGYMKSSDGSGVVPIPNGPKDPKSDSRIYSDGQMKSASFAKRMRDADKIMARLETLEDPQGKDIGYEYSAKELIADYTPIFGGFVNRMGQDDSQSYRQAQEDWVRAKLRRESGAAIGKDEMAQEIDLYFPKYGDSKETIRQKRIARAQATRNLLRESQGAYDRIYSGGDVATPPSPPAVPQDRKQTRKRAKNAQGHIIELNPSTNQWERVE